MSDYACPRCGRWIGCTSAEKPERVRWYCSRCRVWYAPNRATPVEMAIDAPKSETKEGP
jgi:hypothetical protein